MCLYPITLWTEINIFANDIWAVFHSSLRFMMFLNWSWQFTYKTYCTSHQWGEIKKDEEKKTELQIFQLFLLSSKTNTSGSHAPFRSRLPAVASYPSLLPFPVDILGVLSQSFSPLIPSSKSSPLGHFQKPSSQAIQRSQQDIEAGRLASDLPCLSPRANPYYHAHLCSMILSLASPHALSQFTGD